MYFKLEEFKELNNAELTEIINSLQTKSCELDLLPTYMIKENPELFIHIIRKIVNASLREGYFHRDWKKQCLDHYQKRQLYNKMNQIIDQSVIFLLYQKLQKRQ